MDSKIKYSPFVKTAFAAAPSGMITCYIMARIMNYSVAWDAISAEVLARAVGRISGSIFLATLFFFLLLGIGKKYLRRGVRTGPWVNQVAVVRGFLLKSDGHYYYFSKAKFWRSIMGITLRRFVLVVLVLTPFSIYAQSRSKIAILPFDINVRVTDTDHSVTPARMIDISSELQEFITNQLTTQLTKSRLFKVVERSKIDLILKEQAFGLTGMIDESSAAELGMLLAADKLLYGVIEHVGTFSYEVPVTVSAKLVDVTSGQVVAATTAKSLASGGLRKSNILTALEGTVFRIMTDLFNIGIAVAQKKGSEVIINAGKNYGIQSGMAFKAFSTEDELIDPITGESLGREQSESGKVVIKEVHDTWSKGKIVKGRYSIEVGDLLVRTKRPSNWYIVLGVSSGPMGAEMNTSAPVITLNKEKSDTLFVADYSDVEEPEVLNALNASIVWIDIEMTGFGGELRFLLSENSWVLQGLGRKQFSIIPEYFYIHASAGVGYVRYTQDFENFPEYLLDQTGRKTDKKTVNSSGIMSEAAFGGRLSLFGNMDVLVEVGYRIASLGAWGNSYDTGGKDKNGDPVTERIVTPKDYLAIKEIELMHHFFRFGLGVHF